MANDWEKVELSPIWDFEETKELLGVYVSKEEKVGPNNSNLYEFEKPGGERIGVWGSTVLDKRFKNLQFGEEVRVVFKGEAKGEKTGRTYKDFDVYRRKSESGQGSNEKVESQEDEEL